MCTKKEGCIPTVDFNDNWTLFAIVMGSIISLGFIKMTWTAIRYGLMDPPKEEEPPKRYRRKRKHHHHHGSHGTHLGSHSHMSHRSSSHADVHHHHKKHSRASLADHEDGAELKTRSKELTSDSKGSGDKQTEESAV